MVLIESEDLYPFVSEDIPEKYVRKAETELMETEENKSSAIQQLRELMRREKGLPPCATNDEILMMFLRARKFNVARAFCLVKKYANFRKKNIDLYYGVEYDILSKLLKDEVLGFLPYRCQDGCAVLVVRIIKWNPVEICVQDIARAVIFFLAHSLSDPLTQINGYKVLFDFKSQGFKHLKICTPSNLNLIYFGVQECFPGRFKGIHIVNMSLVFKAVWTIIYPFLSEKIRKRLIIHDDLKSLQTYFPERIIPVSFGGQLQSCDNIPWMKNKLQSDSYEDLDDRNKLSAIHL